MTRAKDSLMCTTAILLAAAVSCSKTRVDAGGSGGSGTTHAETVGSAGGPTVAATAPTTLPAKIPQTVAEERAASGSQCTSAPSCEQECTAGIAFSCKAVADLMSLGKVPDDPSRRAKLNRVACDAGVQSACNKLAQQYVAGDGVPRDPQAAMQQWQKSCDAGYGHSCAMQASTLAFGEGIAQDIGRASTMARACCDQGQQTCCKLVKSIADGTIPTIVSLEDIALNANQYARRAIKLESVEVSRVSPTLGLIRPMGGGSADSFKAKPSPEASSDAKKAWLGLQSGYWTSVASVVAWVEPNGSGEPALLISDITPRLASSRNDGEP